jgi:hypothetical protein
MEFESGMNPMWIAVQIVYFYALKVPHANSTMSARQTFAMKENVHLNFASMNVDKMVVRTSAAMVIFAKTTLNAGLALPALMQGV